MTRLVGDVTLRIDLWNLGGMRSKPGSSGRSGGRTRTTERYHQTSFHHVLRDRLEKNSPTLMDVFTSSSEALSVSPPRLEKLILLKFPGGLVDMLAGRGGLSRGDPGGELAIAPIACLATPDYAEIQDKSK